ncbi:MAG: hypothetical protein KC422_07875 [Trueperaceae bacterium]|nr:hypothetical protein [Trueperaceae bacterium]
MSDEPQQTYSAREIVLEFFPATREQLIPVSSAYDLKNHDGQIIIANSKGQDLISLSPVQPSGNASTTLCCDFCQHSGNRYYLQLYRAEVAGSKGRHFFYVSLCKNTEACETRRISDKPIEELLKRLGVTHS